ncbi:hypothetical protein HMN09_00997200 [Mycena chlorophos]|uniref:Uncharacterized protein n=1 Tax=Mycena chlorophos TaxID=658473 RepID=A0A8H6W1U6_MYCCL|nr:hypothetical protein HMN09_00997200 [Mycena chlorophos]
MISTARIGLILAPSQTELLHSASAASPVYPPLQAALGLVAYIKQSFDRFKSNKNEIKAIGAYAQRLSEQLQRSVDGSKTTDYVDVIASLHQYLQHVAQQTKLLQYLHRNEIASRLQEFRGRLWEAFVVFSRTRFLRTSTSKKRNAKRSRVGSMTKRRRARSCRAYPAVSLQAGAGVRELTQEMGLPVDRKSGETMLRDLETEAPHDEVEAVLLKESIALTKLNLKPNYSWFRETFNADVYTKSQIQEALLDSIDDIIQDLRDSGLLAHRTKAELASARDPLPRLDILWKVLGARQRDAVLVRTFQRALFRAGGVIREHSDLINPGLALEEGLVQS